MFRCSNPPPPSTHTFHETIHFGLKILVTPLPHFKVRIIEAIDDIPSKHEKLSSLQ